MNNDKKIWKTKEGGVVEIHNMTDAHLINTLRMIERDAVRGVEVITNLGYDGDDDFITYDIDIVNGKKYLDMIKEYKWIKTEALNRNLITI